MYHTRSSEVRPASRNYNDSDPVDPRAWVRNEELTVKYGVFPDEGVLGEYFFSFGMADIINLKTGEVKPTQINPGTIVLNKDIADDEVRFKSTLLHELIHHILGGYFFLLQKMHGHEYCSYMCRRFDREREQHDKWTPVDIMEMQANKLPGYMMIQDGPGRTHAAELMDDLGGERDIAGIRRVVDQMAEYFETSKTVAKTRLIDFGYNEVRGLMQSANGSLVPSYMSTLRDNETYTIDEADGIKEYLRNEEFRKVIDSGTYLYVEGHYCRNDRRYIYTDQYGWDHLTPYAREHMDECCLVFEQVYQSGLTSVLNGIIRRAPAKKSQEKRYKKKDGSSPVTEEGRKLRAQILKAEANDPFAKKTFNQLTIDLMEWRKMNILPLAEATGLSRDTIKNMRNDPDRVFPIQEVIAVAIALHLAPEQSQEYVRQAPSNFLGTDEMRLYRYALKEWYKLPVAVVNRKLVEMGARPLTKLVDGYDENGVEIEERSSVG